MNEQATLLDTRGPLSSVSTSCSSSFVFTSSRASFSNHIDESRILFLPSSSNSRQHLAFLRPDQLRTHAFGAVHALPTCYNTSRERTDKVETGEGASEVIVRVDIPLDSPAQGGTALYENVLRKAKEGESLFCSPHLSSPSPTPIRRSVSSGSLRNSMSSLSSSIWSKPMSPNSERAGGGSGDWVVFPSVKPDDAAPLVEAKEAPESGYVPLGSKNPATRVFPNSRLLKSKVNKIRSSSTRSSSMPDIPHGIKIPFHILLPSSTFTSDIPLPISTPRTPLDVQRASPNITPREIEYKGVAVARAGLDAGHGAGLGLTFDGHSG